MPHILKRFAACVLLMCALAAICASPSMALPDQVGHTQSKVIKHLTKNTNQDGICRKASVVRRKVIKQLGKQTPGRDICKYGIRGGKKPSRHLETQYLQTLRRMIAPVYQYVGNPVAQTSLGALSYSGVSSAGLPACASESGTNYSTGPQNTNPSSGATGRYQELPEHRRPGGLCYGLSLNPHDQDVCAQIIFAHQGRRAWTNCGG